jgi:BMFP domain-containing protein YqiC
MINKEFLQTLSARLAEILPNPGPVREDLQKQFYSLLQSSFGKLNLVTREEFDAQLKVLERTERQLAELEAKLAELEKNQP